jgi:hypothetical protein
MAVRWATKAKPQIHAVIKSRMSARNACLFMQDMV